MLFIYPQNKNAVKEELFFLHHVYLVLHDRVLVMVHWSCSSGSKSFYACYFIFNYVPKPLFSKLALFWPGEWNKKVDCKHNTESKFGQLRVGLYSPCKVSAPIRLPLTHVKQDKFLENADAHRVAIHASGGKARDKQGHLM